MTRRQVKLPKGGHLKVDVEGQGVGVPNPDGRSIPGPQNGIQLTEHNQPPAPVPPGIRAWAVLLSVGLTATSAYYLLPRADGP
jgi:hypothetical protein